MGGDGRVDVRKKRRRHTTGLQVKLCRGGGRGGEKNLSFVHCRAEFAASLHTEGKHTGVVSIRDEASMGLTAGCQYPQRMVPLTPDNLCQLQCQSVDTL